MHAPPIHPNQRSVRDTLLRARHMAFAQQEAIAHEMAELDFDLDGVSTSTFSHDHALKRTLDSRLADIDEALTRLSDGAYGVCMDCGRDIPAGRLAALPFATRCVPCQSRADRRVRPGVSLVRW